MKEEPRLSSQSKSRMNEPHLADNVSSTRSLYLPLPQLMHSLVALERSPRRVKRPEPHTWVCSAFDKSMILLDQIVQVLDRPQLTAPMQDALLLEFTDGFGIRGITV